MSVIVEAVACTVDDAVRAAAAAAKRIELVAAISEGGLTPSVGTLVEVKRRCPLPVVAMIRPRGGGFRYTSGEFATMQRDAEVLSAAGADGLVAGMIVGDGDVDVVRLRELLAVSAGPWIFHRAFDELADPFAAIDQLDELGFARILTSGQSDNALAGVANLRAFREYAHGRIEIMPGGGVRANNAVEIVRATGALSIHLGPFVTRRDPRSGAEHLALDEGSVAGVAARMRREAL